MQKLSQGKAEKDLAEHYAVHWDTIKCIARGETWTHLKVPGFTPRGNRVGGNKPIISAAQVIQIKELAKTMTQSALAKRFGVAQSLISNIVNDKRKLVARANE